MKFPEHRVSIEAVMPLSDSVLSWLDHQLEVRGIDSVIYTRYVINLLQQDAADIDSTDREEFWDRKVDIKKAKDRKDGKKKAVSEEERQKNAAVECLLSVSDENDDIEHLVEELCGKLKESKSSQGSFSPLSINTKNEPKFQTEKFQDPAERYYAAFPALPGDSPPAQLSPSSEDNFWCKNRKTGSLAGETSDRKEEGSLPRAAPGGKDEKRETTDVVRPLDKKPAAESKSLSNSPAGFEKRKRSVKSDSGQKTTPNGGRNKNVGRDKRESETGSKAVRFLSWPPPGHAKENGKRLESEARNKAEETEEERYCIMVEQMLKEMLLTGNKHTQSASDDISMLAYFPGACFPGVFDDNYFTEWFQDSQEFLENDDWYTQPLERIFCAPASQTKRLYKRHSYPPAMRNLGEQMDWSNLMAEKLVCLTKNTQEYILLGNVFNADGRDDVFNEELLEEGGVLDSEWIEAGQDDASKDQRNQGDVAQEEIDLWEGKSENVADVIQINAVELTELERDISLKLEELTEEAPQEKVDKEEEAIKFATDVEEEQTRDETPSWFYDELPFASPNVLFNFDQHYFVERFAPETEEQSKADHANTSALFFNFPCLQQTSESDCLFLASETSSTVSSVEKGYFSDVTETSYLLDTSRRSSPFPDVLLLMNYGEEDSMSQMTSTASSLKGSRLESLFEASRHQDENICVTSGTPMSEMEPFDVANNDLITYSFEEDEFISYGTKNMFPNGTISKEEPLEFVGQSRGNLELEIQANSLTLLIAPEDSQPKSDSTYEDERDESACFPSDLFNSFSSVGEGSGGSVLLAETRLVDHAYVLDWLDSGEVELQDEYANSLFVQLSPRSGSRGSCWQSKVLLPDYGQTVSFGSLDRQSDLTWDSVLSQTRQQIWASELGRSPYDISPTKKGELWQLWDVNCQKRMHDTWQTANDSNIWNSILNLSIYSPCKSVDPTDFPNDDEVFLAEMISEEDAVLGIQFLEEINGLDYKVPRYERSVSESDLKNMTNTSFLQAVGMSKPNLDINYELVPSENSAFQGVVPKKLHHVRSAPNLQYRSLMAFSFDDGFSSAVVHHAASPTEHLYFSSKTHFRPIQTPVATVVEETEYHPPDLFGGLSQNTGTPYQQYVNPGEEESNFRPKFKLQKDFDKYIQTGGSLDETDVSFEMFMQQHRRVTEDRQSEFIEEVVVGFVLEDQPVDSYSEDHDDRSSDGNKTICSEDENIKISDSVKEETISQACENVLHPCLTDRANSEEIKVTPVNVTKQHVPEQHVPEDSKWDGQKIKEMNLSDHVKDYHDIWSSGYDLDLHPFCVENSGLFFPHTVGDSPCEPEVPKCDEETEVSDPEQCDEADQLYSCYLETYPEVDCYVLTSLPDEAPESQNCDAVGLVPIPHQAVYSSDLEKQWLDKGVFSGKLAKKRFPKTRRDASRQKPCSFFLEGNCKRSDCKFSHDLSHITCRFWEEGLCFKGELCPFFHGYSSDSEGYCGKNSKFEYRKDEFPELDNRGKYMMKDSHSQKISRKRQIHKEFLKKTLSVRRKNRPSAK